ncbi:LPS assembly protein LptD [Phenylobacterium sp. LjRoot225]|uniref:LPS-assembly protein LptD n=1 Tax=Phenylobacterium sp. LjRoot225 TaxID=3342285 RepID=UPI003ECE97F8
MLMGVALAAILAQSPAHAQTRRDQLPAEEKPAKAAKAAPAATPDGLAPDELYMEADVLTRDDKANRTTAEGSVEIRYQGRTLRADRLVYDQGADGQTGVIRAFGHVQMIGSDGSVEFADELTLDDKMSAGVGRGFAARLPDNGKLAATSVVRRSEVIQELNRAIYTPCAICAANGKAKQPTWSIRATRVVQDKKKRLIFYRNARVRVLGVSVLYLPVFWHADPTANRASGFLTPSLGESDRRGFSYEQPYLWAASPSTDVIVSPQLNTKVNPFLNAQVRKRFYSGDVDLRFGYTHEKNVDGSGDRFGESTNRSYVLARGAFHIDDNWLLGFTAERASDPLIFDKYDVGKVYESRGPYVADDRRLISQLYAIREDSQSYFSAAAISIQSLRAGSVAGTIEDNGAIPVIAPLIEQRYSPNTTVLGGRLRLTGSAVALTRDQSPADPTLPGIDSRRVTAQADWRRSFTSAAGLRVDPFVSIRGDAYSLGDVPRASGVGVHSTAVGRGLATAGADISYPVYRRWRDATVVLEPLAQLAVSPNAKQIVVGHDASGNPIYLNEDSATFEFDETNLFKTDKFPGYDLYEDGARLNVAARGSVLWDDGRRASLLVGRSFRSQRNTIFRNGSGLRETASDWIVAGDAQPMKGLSLFARTRLDADTLKVHRIEAGANAQTKWASGFVRYLSNDAEITGASSNSLSGGKQENLDVGGETYFGKNWGASLYGSRDMVSNAWAVRDVGVFYRDDCIRVDVIYRKEDAVFYLLDNTQLRQLGRNEQIVVRLTLATLGGTH